MILITGATGLVGSHLLEVLLQQEQRVRALIRNEKDKSLFGFDTKNVEWYQGDILDVTALDAAMKGVSTVYHCAALVSYAKAQSINLYQINVLGTANVVNLALENDVKKLVHVSSIAALGDGTQGKTITEESTFGNAKNHSTYAVTKHLAELEVWRGMEEGLHVLIVNPTIILGPGNWLKSSTKLFKYVWDENKFYVGGGYNFVDVRDVAEQTARIGQSEKSNEQYIISGQNVTYKEIFNQIAACFNKKAPAIKAGPFLKTIAWIWSNIKAVFSEGEPIITRDAIHKSEHFPSIDNEKIQQGFPHEYRKTEATISWSCKELMKNRG